MESSGTRAGTLSHGELPGEGWRYEPLPIDDENHVNDLPYLFPLPSTVARVMMGPTEEFRRTNEKGELNATVEMTWQEAPLGRWREG